MHRYLAYARIIYGISIINLSIHCWLVPYYNFIIRVYLTAYSDMLNKTILAIRNTFLVRFTVSSLQNTSTSGSFLKWEHIIARYLRKNVFRCWFYLITVFMFSSYNIVPNISRILRQVIGNV